MFRWIIALTASALLLSVGVAQEEITQAFDPDNLSVRLDLEALRAHSKAIRDAPGAWLSLENGQLSVERPTGEALFLSKSEVNALSDVDEGLIVIQHADGSMSANLEGRFQHLATATIGADGRVERSCVNGHAFLPVNIHEFTKPVVSDDEGED